MNPFRVNIRPLSVNEGYTGRRWKTEEHRVWHKSVLFLLPSKLQVPPPPYEIYLKFGFSSEKSDFDNCIKFFVDTIAEKYKFNDKKIRRAVIDIEIVDKRKEFVEFSLNTINEIRNIQVPSGGKTIS